jgi:hypothetical protein
VPVSAGLVPASVRRPDGQRHSHPLPRLPAVRVLLCSAFPCSLRFSMCVLWVFHSGAYCDTTGVTWENLQADE